MDAVALVLRTRPAQRLLLKTVAKRGMEEAAHDAYFENLIQDAGVRRDLTRFLRQVSKRYTLEAAKHFPDFRGPVLLVRGENDPFFQARYARRLRDDFPDARLLFVSNSRAFVPEDRPEALARYIAEFVGANSQIRAAR